MNSNRTYSSGCWPTLDCDQTVHKVDVSSVLSSHIVTHGSGGNNFATVERITEFSSCYTPQAKMTLAHQNCKFRLMKLDL